MRNGRRPESPFDVQAEGGRTTKITVLMGSPNAMGSTGILVRYLSFDDVGMVLGCGCGSPAMTRATRYPDEVYRLGKSLR